MGLLPLTKDGLDRSFRPDTRPKIKFSSLNSRTLGRPILQSFASVCKLPIQCSFLHFLNDFQGPRLALACSRLSPLVARKGQEKGKPCQVVDSRFTRRYRRSASRCGHTSQGRPNASFNKWGSPCPGSLGREGRRGWVGKWVDP